MRTEGQVRRKLRQVIFRHLQKEMRANLRKRPQNCVHNKEVNGLRLCMYGTETKECSVWPTLCDVDHGGVERAKNCDVFQPKVSKEDIKEEMERVLRKPREEVAKLFPAVGALMWVLDENPYTGEVPEEEPEDDDGEEETPEPEEDESPSWNPFKRFGKSK